MASRRNKDIDAVLKDWAFEPGELAVRLIKTRNGREVLQMRVDMGVLQLEVEDRPDGERPEGVSTYYDYLLERVDKKGKRFRLTPDECREVDREFLQFYHRRICWLQLREFARAVRDADHSLALMDLVRDLAPNEEWTESHEQYRPYILFHRTQAAAMLRLEADEPEGSLEELQAGIERIRQAYIEGDAEEEYENDEMVQHLGRQREALRSHYGIGKTLRERLAEAIASEQYELAAQLRDEIQKRGM